MLDWDGIQIPAHSLVSFTFRPLLVVEDYRLYSRELILSSSRFYLPDGKYVQSNDRSDGCISCEFFSILLDSAGRKYTQKDSIQYHSPKSDHDKKKGGNPQIHKFSLYISSYFKYSITQIFKYQKKNFRIFIQSSSHQLRFCKGIEQTRTP